MEFRDYYDTLGVKRDASADDIKRAYRRLARKFHPDVSTEADAEAQFKEMKEAYEVLSDPDKRAAYDQFGENWEAGQNFEPPPGWESQFRRSSTGEAFDGAAGFSDFFNSLFGSGGGFTDGFDDRRGGGFRRSPSSMDGEDMNARITVSLEDAYVGATRHITLQVPEVGSNGQVTRRKRTLKVTIPKGIRDGQRIRLERQGAPGFGEGAKPGDLYLLVDIAPHRQFSLDGRDVTVTLPVAPWEAVLGATVQVPTLGGPVDLKIPPGSNSGNRLRLKGRGLPGTPAGDQFVQLQIVVPTNPDARTRELYEQLAASSSFNPRQSQPRRTTSAGSG